MLGAAYHGIELFVAAFTQEIGFGRSLAIACGGKRCLTAFCVASALALALAYGHPDSAMAAGSVTGSLTASPTRGVCSFVTFTAKCDY